MSWGVDWIKVTKKLERASILASRLGLDSMIERTAMRAANGMLLLVLIILKMQI